jgi:outer membrane protein OmpA-like peptidoglycan-associated protein
MLRLAGTLIILLLLLFSATVYLLDIDPQDLDPSNLQSKQTESAPGAKEESAKAPAESPKGDLETMQDALAPQKPGDDTAPAFDIARIDPNGTSVFAGRAEPKSFVTITADGKEIGTAEADENGEWTFTTETKIPNPDAKLALFKAPHAPKVADATPPAAVRNEPAGKPQSAGTVTSKMIKNLEGMVAEARKEESKNVAAATPPAATSPAGPVAEPALPSADPTAPSAQSRVPLAAATTTAPPSAGPAGQSKSQPGLPPRVETVTVPVPVTFVFNEATLTSDGERAARLLLEYLQLKRFSKVKLTGHADERGTDALNLALSAQRLQTVARFLRDGGFKGQLDLIPKGKSEPYMGVVRADFSQEDLWQLDRRVELMVSR